MIDTRAVLFLAASVGWFSMKAAAAPLELEDKITLGAVAGRIDHMAIDLNRQRLFVAELGNNSVSVVDLAGKAVVKRITGLKEPQGVGYVGASDRLFVANAGDGSLHIYAGDDLHREGQIQLGDDADNIRIDERNRLFVGYGNGAIAVLDSATGSRIADFPLSAHPESFQIDKAGKRVFVNVPSASQIAVIDIASGKQVAKWGLPRERGNFPMTLDTDGARLFAVYRNQPVLAVFDTNKGELIEQIATCGDADDIFFDEKRRRLYISCGAGALWVLDASGAKVKQLAQLPTKVGARTAFFEPTLDRLFVPIREAVGMPAELWIYRPGP
jgi:YVTN family beta-propeller protein